MSPEEGPRTRHPLPEGASVDYPPDLIVIRPEVQKALDKMKASVPNDIRPLFITANEVIASNPRAPAPSTK